VTRVLVRVTSRAYSQLVTECRPGAAGRQAGPLLGLVTVLLLAGCAAGHNAPNGHHAAASPAATASSSGTPTPAAARGAYISFTSYPGWIQDNIPPDKFDYTPWTIINDFGLWPTKTGGIAVGDMDSLAYIPPAVAAAHQAGRMIIMAVGEEGLGAAFAGGASAPYRGRLVASIVSDVSKYGFDGVDVDWEEEVPQHQADYIALVRELRAALDRAFGDRHMFLSADVNPGQIPPPIAARIAPYVDTLNVQSFQDNGVASVNAYLQAGIPADKLLLGIGVAQGYYDTTEARVAAKVKYVEDHGLKGTLLWQPGNLKTYRSDPRLTPLRQMVGITR
jgi:hypothetical protein